MLLFTNLFLATVKILFGFIYKSAALTADGVHSLSDLITDIASLFGEKIALSKTGKKKLILESQTSVAIGSIIIVLGLFMIFKAFNITNTAPSTIVVFIIIFVILIKMILVKYISKMGKKLNIKS